MRTSTNMLLALVLQQRVGKIQKQNGIGGDAEAMNLLTEARLYALDGKFEQARSSEKKAIEIASQAQTTDPLKTSLVPGLAALSSAYIDKGNKLDDADRVVREAVDMVSHDTPGRNGNDFVVDSCIATLTDQYRQSKQFEPAINLLEYLLEKPNRSTRAGSTNTWRYRLARLYLDQSYAATGKSTHRSKAAVEMLRKSKLYFDTAQDISKHDTTINNPTPEQFVRERIEAMRNYGMGEEANELEKQQEAGSPTFPDGQNARPQGSE
jgi:tetratricopeptide (TPR) repeat protein